MAKRKHHQLTQISAWCARHKLSASSNSTGNSLRLYDLYRSLRSWSQDIKWDHGATASYNIQ